MVSGNGSPSSTASAIPCARLARSDRARRPPTRSAQHRTHRASKTGSATSWTSPGRPHTRGRRGELSRRQVMSRAAAHSRKGVHHMATFTVRQGKRYRATHPTQRHRALGRQRDHRRAIAHRRFCGRNRVGHGRQACGGGGLAGTRQHRRDARADYRRGRDLKQRASSYTTTRHAARCWRSVSPR